MLRARNLILISQLDRDFTVALYGCVVCSVYCIGSLFSFFRNGTLYESIAGGLLCGCTVVRVCTVHCAVCKAFFPLFHNYTLYGSFHYWIVVRLYGCTGVQCKVFMVSFFSFFIMVLPYGTLRTGTKDYAVLRLQRLCSVQCVSLSFFSYWYSRIVPYKIIAREGWYNHKVLKFSFSIYFLFFRWFLSFIYKAFLFILYILFVLYYFYYYIFMK